MSGPRVALAGMILESNRYAKPAELEDFTSLTWLEGDSLLQEARKPVPALAAEFAAFVRAMDATGPWAACPLILAASHPAGPVRRDVFNLVIERMLDGLEDASPIDAVYLAHHGAMVAEHLDDPDGEIFALVRERLGATPLIVSTLDLHANISAKMVESVDLIVGYRTNPHVDMIERGEEAAFSLRRILASGTKPKAALVKPPLVPASVTLLTANHPYGTLIDYGQRRQAEAAGGILNVSVFGNFVFSDVPDNGVSVVVTARDDETKAIELAHDIAMHAWDSREDFVRNLTPLSDAVARSLNTSAKPTLFSDAGDNPGGGGSGRTTEFLGALLEAGAKDVLYGSFCDPELAEDAHNAGVGAHLVAQFNRSQGNDAWETWDRPLTVDAEVLALSDGSVVGERGLFGGRQLSLGQSAALKIGGVTVVVISDRSQTADPVFFRMLGLAPEEACVVVVKSRGHFRAGFDLWFAPEQIFEVDTGGLTSPVLSRWPLKRIPRPSFPLDPDTDWDT